jgi:hypothetical protein
VKNQRSCWRSSSSEPRKRTINDASATNALKVIVKPATARIGPTIGSSAWMPKGFEIVPPCSSPCVPGRIQKPTTNAMLAPT